MLWCDVASTHDEQKFEPQNHRERHRDGKGMGLNPPTADLRH